MENKKTSAAQLRATKKYQKKHKKSTYRNQKKSRAKNFILNDARLDELQYFKQLIAEREVFLKNNLQSKD